MPWNESTKMDEKLRFVSRFLDGEKIAPYVPSLVFPESPAIRSLSGIKIVVWKLLRIVLEDPFAKPTACPSRLSS